MNDQDREAFEELTEGIPPIHHDYGMLLDGFKAGLAHARQQTAELRAMLDELLLSVQGENIYLCDDVWALADKIAAQLKEQDDE